MIKSVISALSLATGLLLIPVVSADAGDCTGWVVGVRPLSQYNHNLGNGYLAVRTGPGSNYRQIGEVYLGDEISVWNRRGGWYEIYCMSGTCTHPLWGACVKRDWVSSKMTVWR